MATPRHTKLLIIGAGPAGYTAAIYAARANLAPILIQGLQPGGQLSITTDVENYPGFAEAIQGPWLMDQMQAQAAHCGAELLFDVVTEVDLAARPFPLRLRQRRRSHRRCADHRRPAPRRAGWACRASSISQAPASRPAPPATASSSAAAGGRRRRRQYRRRGGALSGADVREGHADPPARLAARREDDAGPPAGASQDRGGLEHASSRRSCGTREAQAVSRIWRCMTSSSGAVSELAVRRAVRRHRP